MPTIFHNGRYYHTQDDNFIDDLKAHYRMESAIGDTLMNQHRQMHASTAKIDRAVGKTALFMAKGIGKASFQTAKFIGKSSFKAGKAIKERASERFDRERFVERRGL